MSERKDLLRVNKLEISLVEKSGMIKIVDKIDLKIRKGETVGLIGPSGTGKSITAKAILGILQGIGHPNWIIDGEVFYKNMNLMKLPENELRELRGKEISIIFQKPTSSLNPILMIGQQTGEPVEAHDDVEAQKLKEMVIWILILFISFGISILIT